MKKLTMGFIINFSYCIATVSRPSPPPPHGRVPPGSGARCSGAFPGTRTVGEGTAGRTAGKQTGADR